MKKSQIEKKMNSALQHLRTDFRSMMGEEHRDIFLNYDKIIDFYASKFLRKMLLINPLREN